MQQIAQAWLVLELTGDPFMLGLVAAAQYIPVLVFGLFGGVAADAFPKRRSLMATQVLAGLLALALGLLVLQGNVQVWQVIVLAFLLGIVTAFDMPIRQSFVVEMVGREDVGGAVALNSALFNGARIVGPALAGLTIGLIGIAPCFLLNAASYLAVVASIAAIRQEDLHAQAVARVGRSVRSIVDQLAEGLRYVRESPHILLPISVVGVVSTAAFNFQVLMPLVARDLLSGGAETYGFLMAAGGVGSLVIALGLAVGQRATIRRVLLGAAAAGISVALMALSRSLPVSMLLMAVAGAGLIAMAATTNMIIQLTVPDLLRGRVMSVYTTVFVGSTPFGGLIMGVIAGWAGVAAALAAGGLVSLGMAGFAARVAQSAGIVSGEPLQTVRIAPDPVEVEAAPDVAGRETRSPAASARHGSPR
jgi:MFS family permease